MFLSLQKKKKKMKSDEENELEDYNPPDNYVDSESDEDYKSDSELDSDQEWEFDENYKKNLEKDYEEEQRQEFEEEDGLKEELEREATGKSICYVTITKLLTFFIELNFLHCYHVLFMHLCKIHTTKNVFLLEPSSNELSEDEMEGNSMLNIPKAEREGVIVQMTIKPLGE